MSFRFRSLWAALGVLAALGCGEGVPETETTAESEGLELASTQQALVTAGARDSGYVAYAKLTPVAVFHVSVSGNDSYPGTAAQPWRTLTKAVRTLLPGQAAYVHAGTYYEHVAITARDGTAQAPIFLMGA